MKKPSLAAVMTRKDAPDPPAAAPPAPPVTKADRIATTLHIDPDRLERLKIVAARRRVRVNALVLEGIDHILTLNEVKT